MLREDVATAEDTTLAFEVTLVEAGYDIDDIALLLGVYATTEELVE